MKLGALLELAEKTVVLGSIGKLLVDEIQLDRTEPGQGRVYYDGFGRTDQLMSEAQRCIQDVVFNPSADGQGPPESSPFPADGQQQQFEQGQGYDERRPSVQDGQFGSYRQEATNHNGGGAYNHPAHNDYDHNQQDHGLAYPNPTQLPPVETGSFAEDFNTPSYQPNSTADFASKARDRSSLAYMTGGESDDQHDLPPPVPSLPGLGSTVDPGLSPISDRSETEDLTYQRELEQERQRRAEEQQHQSFRRPSAEQYRYDGLSDPDAQYAPVRADATPHVGSNYTPEASPASQSFGHPHDKSVEPLVPRWGAHEPEEQGISYNPPAKPSTYAEERPYVPKANDGAYRGPSLDPPLSATSDRGGNNSRGGSSVGGGSLSERPLSPNGPSDGFRPAFVPQKKERPVPANRRDSALGSKYGDLGSPSVGGTTPTGTSSGRFALGGGATVGAQEGGSGYFRAADATSPGSGMELPSQRIKAGAFRRPDPQYYPSNSGSTSGRYGAPPPLTHSASGRSEAEEIKDAYRSSAVPMPSSSRGGADGDDEPQRFDTAPLRIGEGVRGGPRPPQVPQHLAHSSSVHSMGSAYTESEIGTTVSQATYHPVNRVQLSQQARPGSPAGSGTPTAGSAGRGFGGGGYVTRLD